MTIQLTKITPTGKHGLAVRFRKKGDEVWVNIRVPGDATQIWDRPFRPDEDMVRFGAEYEAFVAGREGPVGTPLSALEIPEGHVEELVREGFDTVEAIASASDASIQRLMGGWGLQRKAREFLEARVIPPAVQNEINKLQEQINDLRKQVEGVNRG